VVYKAGASDGWEDFQLIPAPSHNHAPSWNRYTPTERNPGDFPEGGSAKTGGAGLISSLARLALQAESSQANLGIKIVPISICYSNQQCPGDARSRFALALVQHSLKQDAKQLTTALEERTQRTKQLEREARNERQKEYKLRFSPAPHLPISFIQRPRELIKQSLSLTEKQELVKTQSELR